MAGAGSSGGCSLYLNGGASMLSSSVLLSLLRAGSQRQLIFFFFFSGALFLCFPLPFPKAAEGNSLNDQIIIEAA